MPSRATEQALKRLIVKLAAASPGDILAVLAGLEEHQRERAEELLSRYDGRWTEARAGERADELGLSSWLAARIDAGQPGGGSHAMTPGAVAALRACAVELSRDPQPRRAESRSAASGFRNALLARRAP